MSRRHRPSLLGALLWIGLGALILLRNFGIGPDLWYLAGHYWPVLLILLGLGKIIDYFLQRQAVSIRVGEIIGILLLVIIGLTIQTHSQMGRFVWNFPFEIGGVPVQPGQWVGEFHTYSEETSFPLEYQVPIHIENSNGSVSISPGSDREVRVRLKKIVPGSESRAKKIADEIHVEGVSEGKNQAPAPLKPEAEPGMATDAEYFLVRTNRDALSSKDLLFTTNMEILVPKNSQIQVRNTFGEVTVSDIHGDLDLSTTHKILDVRNCTGQFTISTQYAETRLTDLEGNVHLNGRGRVYLENIKGDVSVTDEYSSVEIFNIDGKLSVSTTEGSMRIEKVTKPVVIDSRGSSVQIRDLKDSLKVAISNKSVDISDVASSVVLESRYSTLKLKKLGGAVEINSNSDSIHADDIRGNLTVKARASGLRLNDIVGAMDIRTTLKDVIVNGLEGGCNITNEYADVSVSVRSLGHGNIAIKDRNGAIDLFLPEGASFVMDAAARNGKVESDYGGLEPMEKVGTTGALRSKVKSGGTKITLENEYGDIRISPSGT
jgi:DUF4097 and DUF4098 domain-containing protein YvlB